MTGPGAGDRVRAIVDRRGDEVVEGILNLRYIPSLDYIQVNVVVDRNIRSVRPDSVVCLEAGCVAPEALEAIDPLYGRPGWRPVRDLADAMASGLVPPAVDRVGGSWDDLFAALRSLAAPLLAGGWEVTDTWRDESWEYGDSVFYFFGRGDQTIELEYDEHGSLVGWPPGLSDPDAEDPDPPLFTIDDADAANAAEAFQGQGWLNLAPPKGEP